MRQVSDMLKTESGKSPAERARAQQLAFQALETGDPEEAATCAIRAAELDPTCVDALTVLAQASARTESELIEHLEAIVEIAEHSLGQKFFAEHRGEFWSRVETRPYMRVRKELADSLRCTGRTCEAIAHYEALLELNPDDNQAVRDILLCTYLAEARLKEARRLFQRYQGDFSAMFHWGRVLERHLAEDPTAAREALCIARRQNPHVESYLTERKALPDQIPYTYEFGDENEAVYCATFLRSAWSRHADTLTWLKSR